MTKRYHLIWIIQDAHIKIKKKDVIHARYIKELTGIQFKIDNMNKKPTFMFMGPRIEISYRIEFRDFLGMILCTELSRP